MRMPHAWSDHSESLEDMRSSRAGRKSSRRPERLSVATLWRSSHLEEKPAIIRERSGPLHFRSDISRDSLALNRIARKNIGEAILKRFYEVHSSSI